MKGHKLVKDHQHSFEIMGPDGKSFHVAKHKLSLPMMVELSKLPQHLDEGGEADAPGDKYAGLYQAEVSENPELADQPVSQTPLARWLSGDFSGKTMAEMDKENASSPEEKLQAQTQTEILPTNGINVAALNPNDIGPQGEAPQTSTPAPTPPGDDYLKQLQDIASSTKGALGQMATAENTYADTSKMILEQQSRAMAAADLKSQQDLAKINKENDEINEGIKNGKIDPARIWNDAGIFSKIGMLASMIIGGYGSGGDANNNIGLKLFNAAMDRDLKAQEAELGKKQSLLTYNMHKYGNLTAAQNATKMQMLSAFKGQLEVAALNKGTMDTKARAQIAMSQVDQQYIKLANDFKLNNMRLADFSPDSAWGGDGTPPTDAEGLPNPAFYGINMQKLRLGQAIQGIPEKELASVMKDVGDYGKLKHTTDNLVEAFKKVDQEQDPTNRVVNFMQSKSSINKIEKEFSAQLAKDLEGRATPQDIDSIMENFPGLTDNAETRKLGLQNMMNSIKGKFGDLRNLQLYGLVHPHDPYLHTTSQTKSLADQAFRKVP